MEWTLSLILGLAGVAVILYGIGVFGKTKGKHWPWLLGGALIALFGFGMLTPPSILQGIFSQEPLEITGGGTGGTGGDGAGDGITIAADWKGVTPIFVEEYTGTVRHDTYNYKLGGLDSTETKTGASPDTAETVPSPGDTITFYFNANGSTDTYDEIFGPFVIPSNKPSYVPTFKVKPTTTSQLTLTVTNSDGSTINAGVTGTNCEDLTAGDVKTLKIHVCPKYQKFFGSEHTGVCATYNNTGQYDDVILSGTGLTNLVGNDGESKTEFLSVASGSNKKCYMSDALTSDGIGGDCIDIYMTVDVDDETYDGAAGSAQNITIDFIGDEAYRNTKLGNIPYRVGFQNIASAGQVGPTTESKVVCVQ